MILAAKTDNPTTELYLLNLAGEAIGSEIWESGRQLSEQLLGRIDDLLKHHEVEWGSLTGVIAYAGPGSFTGLRIGLTTLNAIAYAKSIPVISSKGEAWLQDGVVGLHGAKLGQFVLPFYGGEANITKPRK